MIIAMSKVRILGPRERLPDVLRTLQDLSLLHLAAPQVTPDAPLGRAALGASQERERRHLQQVLADIDAGMDELHLRPTSELRLPIAFAVLLVVLLLKPNGLFGRREVRRV